MISKFLQILGLQNRISKVLLVRWNKFFLTVGQNNFGNKIPIRRSAAVFFTCSKSHHVLAEWVDSTFIKPSLSWTLKVQVSSFKSALTHIFILTSRGKYLFDMGFFYEVSAGAAYLTCWNLEDDMWPVTWPLFYIKGH